MPVKNTTREQTPPLKHRWKPGQSGNPKGRPKGAKNPDMFTSQVIERLARETHSMSRARKMSPLEFLVWVCQNEDVRLATRIDAAKATLPYLHRKMPIAVEGGNPDKPIVLSPQVVHSMSKEDLMQLHALLSKTALPTLAKPIIDAVASREAESDDQSEQEPPTE